MARRGTALGTVVEVREDYRYHRLFVKHRYDCFPGYIALYLDRIDLPVLQNRKKYETERYARLNRDAVRSVYQYTDRITRGRAVGELRVCTRAYHFPDAGGPDSKGPGPL